MAINDLDQPLKGVKYQPEEFQFHRRHNIQEPIAIVGLACRLPGNCNTPTALWDFLVRGGCADITPPASRFCFKGHHDGSRKPKTMAAPGGMFLENVDLQDFDTQFFKISSMEAISMDPQQRQLLEVIYEGLENAGISLEVLNGQPFGCFVGSYASDYGDIQARDPEDRAPATTLGIGRAMLSNRISHFLNIKGPSMTIDAACSGSLVGVDVANRYLQTREINGAIVAGCNLYLSPEHTMDHIAVSGTASPSGKCHTFDIKADGYIKSEAVNMVVLKRLDDAIKDGDPIRAIIRGSATNSNGWTAGIASPSPEAQAAAIRQAYKNANISDYSATSFLECHGTGTQAGDPAEVAGIASVFSANRCVEEPLLIGSIKSNIGHSEPAAGISGLLKAVLALEKGIIPGNPTFETPNPRINFEALKVRPFKTSIRWPDVPLRRASVNSFGYGGSNAHVVLDAYNGSSSQSVTRFTTSSLSDDDDFFAEETAVQRYTLVFSANDAQSLRSYCKALQRHLVNPGVRIKLRDLAYTLSERRTQHFYRGYIVSQSCKLDEASFVFGNTRPNPPRIGFVFTGQGAQWSEMGRDLVSTFPLVKVVLKHLDDVLHSLPDSPSWSLLELVEPRSSEHLRLPEFSQPLLTAMQLAILAVLNNWGIRCQSVVGHSSGEIAAAVAAGYLTPEEAIKVAYYRGKAASNIQDVPKDAVGMLAVGLGTEKVQQYLLSVSSVEIGCINSPNSVTLSGNLIQLTGLKTAIQQDGYFAQILRVDLAYHSSFMAEIAVRYNDLLVQNCVLPLIEGRDVAMFSSVTGKLNTDGCDAGYWTSNMVSPVLFNQAMHEMISDPAGAEFLIEVGPSGTLARPIAEIKQSMTGSVATLEYVSACKRGPDAVQAIFDMAGRLFISGASINMLEVNRDLEPAPPSIIIDLPNYVWNHSIKYWYESEASKDWRFRKFPNHDLLGSKILGTAWTAPSWRKTLKVQDLPWLKDHKLGNNIVFPAAGYVAMAVEALFQKSKSTGRLGDHIQRHEVCYRLRNVTFPRAMVLKEMGNGLNVLLCLNPCHGAQNLWHEFKVLSLAEDVSDEHCLGIICLGENSAEGDFVYHSSIFGASTKLFAVGSEKDLRPFEHSSPAQLWYKAMQDVGYDFGPHFRRQVKVESTPGMRHNRALVKLSEPPSNISPSSYSMHPICIDGCFQSAAPSLWQGNRSTIDAILIPAMIGEVIIKPQSARSDTGIAVSSAEYSGVGGPEEIKSYKSKVSVFDSNNKLLLFQMSGLLYHKLDNIDNPHASHIYTRLVWKPDISLLSQSQLLDLITDDKSYKVHQDSSVLLPQVDKIIDMVAHKTPNLKVMEINMIKRSESIWLEGCLSNIPSRAACRRCHFALSSVDTLVDAQDKYRICHNTEFSILDLSKPITRFESNQIEYDLIIVKLSLPKAALTNVIKNVRQFLCSTGYVLLIYQDFPGPDSNLDPTCASPSDVKGFLQASGFHNSLQIWHGEKGSSTFPAAYTAFAASQDAEIPTFDHRIDLVRFSTYSKANGSIKEGLARFGWHITEHMLPFSTLQSQRTVLVLDELEYPVLAGTSTEQWHALQHLIDRGSRILWVTTGSQLEVTKPNNALIHGLARTLRAEDPSLIMITLDVESSSGCEATIHLVLKQMQALMRPGAIDMEFVERRGVIHISRLLPDNPINKAERNSVCGTDPHMQPLHSHKSCVRLICERVGTLDSLQYVEVSTDEIPLEDGFVEVDIYVASLNFKDLAVTMGLVPADQHLLGLEGAGLIRRVGKHAGQFKVGQRVLVSRKGSLANRVQSPVEAVYPLPDTMSFEDAATLPCVYLISIYGLIDLANTQRGQSVLIHSAAGGVGIAAIQLCQYLGAEIYATVGTEEKKRFLIKTFGILPERIFSSRSTAFSSRLMRATNGRGVDVILNSLSNEMLDESWRCIADNGTFVEIGKKDMLDRNSLSMEPFCRNASYRAIDMSHDSIPLATIARLLSQIFHMISEGHIVPLYPRKVFPFHDIVGAFRYMRAGNHIGKILISDGPDRSNQVLIRPATPTLTLRPMVSYLIVGGLKGICGSLAIFLARHGARYLIIMARSDYNDEQSQGILTHLKSLGTHVQLVQGDVSNLEDVQKMFRGPTKPIAGIIQGAMVLRDKIFASMTVEDFHDATRAKVRGTWNLHNTALEQNVPLDFFTMLSSISGIVGQKSQANYAAANVFLDSFSAYRRGLGLAACSVDLGVIEDVGYISKREALAKRLDPTIWTGINEGLLHKILRFSILQQQLTPINPDSAAQMITGITVPQKEDSFLHRDARFTGLCIGPGGSTAKSTLVPESGSNKLQAFVSLLKAEQVDISVLVDAAIDLANGHFMKSLGLSEPMEPTKALSGYGIDSLAAVEFRNWVRAELGGEVTILEIINAKTLVSLCEVVIGKLRGV